MWLPADATARQHRAWSSRRPSALSCPRSSCRASGGWGSRCRARERRRGSKVAVYSKHTTHKHSKSPPFPDGKWPPNLDLVVEHNPLAGIVGSGSRSHAGAAIESSHGRTQERSNFAVRSSRCPRMASILDLPAEVRSSSDRTVLTACSCCSRSSCTASPQRSPP